MPCYYPVRAYQLPTGALTFKSPTTHDGSPLDLSCGQCIGCRLQRASDWALRCYHESTLHATNSYVTLTYQDKALPPNADLRYRDFQLFMMRLRTAHGPGIRFFMCGEYGEQNFRPHYHACLFGYRPADPCIAGKNKQGDQLYSSATLDRLWGHNDPDNCPSLFGDVTRQSAGYCARYILGKGGHESEARRQGRTPEFNRSSNRPGIGARWLSHFRSDVFPCDYVVDTDGHKHHVPKYYDRLNKRFNAGELVEVKATRAYRASLNAHDNTPSRLRVKEEVQRAAVRTLTREL